MKQSTLVFLSFLVFMATGCSPADPKHNPTNRSANPNSQSQRLRVGTFGQTIWAAQHLEQVGALLSQCLESQDSVQQRAQGFVKLCQIRYKSSANEQGPQISERWSVELNLEAVENQKYRVVSASGQSSSGRNMSSFKGQNVFMRHEDKSFSLQKKAQGLFDISMNSMGDMGSASEKMTFELSLSAVGQEVVQEGTRSWVLQNAQYELTLLEQRQVFNISFPQLKLVWVSPFCAQYEGEASAVESGRKPTALRLTQSQALQVMTNGRSGWSQAYLPCQLPGESQDGKRSQAVLNLDFLFF
jgi:hypothetical protein